MDFIAEFTIPNEDNAPNETERWTVQIDSLSTQKRGGVKVIIITPKREMLKYGVQIKFPTTNNEVEYERILTGLRA